MMGFFKKRQIVTTEENVTTILSVVNFQHAVIKGVGKCVWKKVPAEWNVTFYTSDKRWRKIVDDLNGCGVLLLVARPGRTYVTFKKRKEKGN